MHGCPISTVVLPLGILFQYGLINTNMVTHHSLPDTKQHRPRAIDSDRSQIWAGDKTVRLPKQLKPQWDFSWRSINKSSRKRKTFMWSYVPPCSRAREVWAAGHSTLKACSDCTVGFTSNNPQHISAVSWDTVTVLTLCLSQWNKAYEHTSIAWCHLQTYSGREQVALDPASTEYWSVLSLWEGPTGAGGSFIKLTLRVTRWAEAAAAAASKRCNASMSTFCFFVSLSACEPRETPGL